MEDKTNKYILASVIIVFLAMLLMLYGIAESYKEVSQKQDKIINYCLE